MLSFVPRPASALLLVFPVSKNYETFRMQEDADKAVYEGKGEGEPVIWYKQTIRNACGLIGVLHAVSNGGARNFIGMEFNLPGAFLWREGWVLIYLALEPESDLHNLVQSAIPLAPIERADLLYNSKALESAHADAASQGQSNAPDATDDIDLHFVCFVKDEKNQLWELDGRRKGPLNRGHLAEVEDVLSETALELGPRKFLKREAELGQGELRFSIVALSPSMD
jgi:ubiquitin carboxyl-terminal hydrolase L3